MEPLGPRCHWEEVPRAAVEAVTARCLQFNGVTLKIVILKEGKSSRLHLGACGLREGLLIVPEEQQR